MNRGGLLVFFSIIFLSGCTEKTMPTENKQPSQINRIISAAPSYTEIIAGLGLADKLIAVDKYSHDVEGVRKDLPEIDFFYPDIEAIAGLKPDIIISGEINTNGNADTSYQFFRRLGIEVMEVPTSNSIEDIYGDIIRIAEALGVRDRGESVVNRMKEQIAAVSGRAGAGGKAGKKSVYFEITPAPTMVSFGRGTYLNELIEIIGARNIFAAEERWFAPGAEAIILADPDVILAMSYEGEGAAVTAEIKGRPGFEALAAVRQNMVFAVNGNHASRPSQNIVLALEEMYRAVWQEKQ